MASGGNGHWYQRLCFDTLVPWQTAENNAEAQGHYLATLTSAAENQFVLDNLITSCNCNYWAGGQQAADQQATDTGWSWVNGDGALVYTNWNSPPEPNDQNDVESNEENCLEVSESGYWNDQNCGLDSGDLLFGQLVEWEAPCADSAPIQWTVASGGNGHWYQRLCSGTLIPWQTTEDDAEAQGHYLATLTSADENQFVTDNVITSCNCNYWAGGAQAADQQATDDGWSWVNGDGPFVFTNWNSPEPNDQNGVESNEENCLEVSESGYWNDQNCALDPGDLLFGQLVEWEEPAPEPEPTCNGQSGVTAETNVTTTATCTATVRVVKHFTDGSDRTVRVSLECHLADSVTHDGSETLGDGDVVNYAVTFTGEAVHCTVAEHGPGEYYQSTACEDDGRLIGSVRRGDYDFELDAGDAYTCTFTNRPVVSGSDSESNGGGRSGGRSGSGCDGILTGFRPPAAGGFGTFAFCGGSFIELLEASGCSAATAAFFYNKLDGTFAVWLPGADVSMVNAEILALFKGTSGIPRGTIFTGRCV